jgi:hypothetical protein
MKFANATKFNRKSGGAEGSAVTLDRQQISAARYPGLPLKFFVKLAGRAGDVNASGNSTLPILYSFHNARCFTAFRTFNALGSVYHFRTIGGLGYFCHGLSPWGFMTHFRPLGSPGVAEDCEMVCSVSQGQCWETPLNLVYTTA